MKFYIKDSHVIIHHEEMKEGESGKFEMIIFPVEIKSLSHTEMMLIQEYRSDHIPMIYVRPDVLNEYLKLTEEEVQYLLIGSGHYDDLIRLFPENPEFVEMKYLVENRLQETVKSHKKRLQ